MSRILIIEDEDGIQLWEDKKYDESRKIYFHWNLRILIPAIVVMEALNFYFAHRV